MRVRLRGNDGIEICHVFVNRHTGRCLPLLHLRVGDRLVPGEKHRRGTASVKKQHSLVWTDLSPPNVVDETRKRLRGVRGIQEQALRPGRKAQGSHGRFGERAVPNPDVGVIIADLGRVKREIQLEERCRSHHDLGDHRRLIGNERARGDADQAIRERKDLPCQREASLSRRARAEVRDIRSPAERLELFLQLKGCLDVAERGEGHRVGVPPQGVDDIRPFALRGERVHPATRNLFKLVVEPFGRDEPTFGSEDRVQQEVPLDADGTLAAKDQAGAQPKLGTRGSELAAMVRVDAGPGDDGRRTRVNRFAEKILELAHLVPAQRQTSEIVPLHVDRGPAQSAAEARRGLEGGRQMRERHARQPSQRPAQVSDTHTIGHTPLPALPSVWRTAFWHRPCLSAIKP